MSHYKPYPVYKDSGVEWLGRVPEHWQIKRLKHIASVQTGVAKGKDHGGKETIEVPYLRVANVQDGYLSLDDVATIEIPREDLTRYSLQSGDVLMNEGGDFDKLGRGSVWLEEIEPCIHQNHVFAVRPTAVSSAWLNAFTGSLAAQFYFMGRAKQSTNLASISSSNIMELAVAMPPATEVDLLLAHLDRETARIDALIEKKTRFIELLREKRQALITHAVTKGLDPSVKMKNSGVDWLGEVPEHWDCCLFKHKCLNVTDGAHISPDTVNGVNFFVSTKDIVEGRIDFAGALLTSADSYEYLVRTGCNPIEGDVLFSKDGTIGRTVVVRGAPEFVVASSLIIIRPELRTLNSDFFNYFCQSKVVASQVESLVRGAGLPRISIQNLLKIIGVFPPLTEQRVIVEFLDTEVSRIDSLIRKTDRSIDLLKERRSALITAAVSGQIDLRGAV